LPALPKAWPQGAVAGLRARGGYTVDLSWQDGRLATATLRARHAGACRLRTLEPVELTRNGQHVVTRRVDAECVEFSAVAGGEYRVAPSSQ